MTEHKKHILPLLLLITAVSCAFLISEQSSNAIAATPSLPKQQRHFNTVAYASGRDLTMSKFIDNIHTDPLFMSGINILTPVIKTIPSYDTTGDDSLTRFVSKNIPLSNKKYIPSDLVIISDKHLILSKRKFQLRKEANEQLKLMAKEFNNIFKKKLVIVSAYRSYKYQEGMRKKGCSDTLCAPAGYSEHQLGLAIDLFAATDSGSFLSKKDFAEYYKRLAANAHRYGRHNSYQKGVAIDTYQEEPRHWRYIGRDLATELYDKKMTFGERITKQ